MARKFIYIVCCVILLASCKAILIKSHGGNSSYHFDNKNDYLLRAEKNNIDSTRLYYVSKTDYDKFISYIVAQKIDYYYGMFLNDTCVITKRSFFMENQTCGGRIIAELDSSLKSDVCMYDNILHQYTLNSVIDNKKMILPANKRIALFLYSYKMGNIHKPDFQNVDEFMHKHGHADYYIISIDPFFSYK